MIITFGSQVIGGQDGSSAQAPDYGLLSDLLSQTGNDGDRKIRLAYTGAVIGNYFKGTYNPASTYLAGERVSLSAAAKFWYIALQNVPTSNPPNPYKNTVYWAIEAGAEMLQDMEDGTYIRYTLGFNQDDLIRWGSIQRGTLSQTSTALSTGNFTGSSSFGTSSTNIVLSSNPAAYSITLNTGLPIASKTNLGASTSSMTILGSGSSPSFVTVNLPSGQGLVTGNTLKLENSSSNFNIAVVIDYNNTTGVSLIGIINGVGAGTFTSWTIYKVSLIYMTWDTAPTSVYMHAIVDTYTSGTGAATITTYVQLGSGTRSPWTVFNGRTPGAIPSSQVTEITQNGTPLGMFTTGVYKGTQFTHNAIKRPEATGWIYYVKKRDGTWQSYTIDCYASSGATQSQITVASNLDIAGDDGLPYIAFSITSPSGSSTNARATIDASTTTSNFQSHNYLADIDVFTATIPFAGQGDSSGELAWNFNLNGTADTKVWLPDHNFDKVSFGRNRTYTVDDVVIDISDVTNNPYAYKFQNYTSFRLNQTVEVYHPNVVAKMANVSTIHELELGLYYKVIVDPLQDWNIATGYVHMIAFPQDGSGNRWFNKFTTDIGNTFTWPGGTSVQNLNSNQIGWQSALMTSTNSTYTGNQNFALATWWADTSLWRIGQIGKGQDAIGYSAGPKLYPKPYADYILTTGTQVVIEGRLFAGFKGSLT